MHSKWCVLSAGWCLQVFLTDCFSLYQAGRTPAASSDPKLTLYQISDIWILIFRQDVEVSAGWVSNTHDSMLKFPELAMDILDIPSWRVSVTEFRHTARGAALNACQDLPRAINKNLPIDSIDAYAQGVMGGIMDATRETKDSNSIKCFESQIDLAIAGARMSRWSFPTLRLICAWSTQTGGKSKPLMHAGTIVWRCCCSKVRCLL